MLSSISLQQPRARDCYAPEGKLGRFRLPVAQAIYTSHVSPIWQKSKQSFAALIRWRAGYANLHLLNAEVSFVEGTSRYKPNRQRDGSADALRQSPAGAWPSSRHQLRATRMARI